jgi:hypothetical protein
LIPEETKEEKERKLDPEINELADSQAEKKFFIKKDV